MPRGLNKVMLIGNLGRDPEVRYTSDGKPVATFSVATSRFRRDPNGNWTDETEWHRIVAWERLAEIATEYLHKGSKVYIEGRIQSRKYTDNQGIERTTHEIVAHDLTLLDRREDGAGAADDWEEASTPQAPPQPPQRKAPESNPSEDIDDVPF